MLYYTHDSSASSSNSLSLKLALVLSLTFTSWTVSAEQSRLFHTTQTKPFTHILNDIAAVNSNLTDPIEVNEHWTRIELDGDFINPVVIPDIETINSTADGAFMLGIRNADENGFEVRLERCQQTSSMQLPEVVYIAILESGKYPTSNGAQIQVKQRFLWGQCQTPVQQASVAY